MHEAVLARHGRSTESGVRTRVGRARARGVVEWGSRGRRARAPLGRGVRVPLVTRGRSRTRSPPAPWPRCSQRRGQRQLRSRRGGHRLRARRPRLVGLRACRRSGNAMRSTPGRARRTRSVCVTADRARVGLTAGRMRISPGCRLSRRRTRSPSARGVECNEARSVSRSVRSRAARRRRREADRGDGSCRVRSGAGRGRGPPRRVRTSSSSTARRSSRWSSTPCVPRSASAPATQRGAFGQRSPAPGEGATPPTMCRVADAAGSARARRCGPGGARRRQAPPRRCSPSLDELVERFPHVIVDRRGMTELVRSQIQSARRDVPRGTGAARAPRTKPTVWTIAAEACADAGSTPGRRRTRAGVRRRRCSVEERSAAGAGAPPARPRARREPRRPGRSRTSCATWRRGHASRSPIRRPRPPNAAALPGLTAREREILALVAVGRTYAEIAHELVISEKTVSTHISHLLAKTGTANRVELAGLVHRVGQDR